ncbi:MAG TPA: DUF3089 domain-containing protein [Vicinamibacterales bacterium]|nr:DUF3089 domain-containing protein [Vicinamibacterales bacterium]
MRRSALLAVLFMVAITAARAGAQAPSAPPAAQPAPNDYTQDAAWLCRPGRQDACAIDLTATVVNADGSMTREDWKPGVDVPIDCFYVYPTISTDPGTFSDMTPDPAERNVVAQQFARFASVCRPFAPLYRQVTIAGLRQRLAGGGIDLGTGSPYDDVRDAWRDYLQRDNRGRGVVLIGHSQGSYVLIELLRHEIEGKPAQKQLVSAILTGTTISVPKGAVTGGTFKTLGPCHSARDTGCVISFSTYRATVPPPPNALFGRHENGQDALCTNPAGFSDGAADLHAYLSTAGRTITSQASPAAWVTGKTVDTPWVEVPGLVSARCTSNEFATYLEVTVKSDPTDPRVDDITGDLGMPGKPLPNWGLHLVDMNLTMGDLIAAVDQQGRAWSLKSEKLK